MHPVVIQIIPGRRGLMRGKEFGKGQPFTDEWTVKQSHSQTGAHPIRQMLRQLFLNGGGLAARFTPIALQILRRLAEFPEVSDRGIRLQLAIVLTGDPAKGMFLNIKPNQKYSKGYYRTIPTL